METPNARLPQDDFFQQVQESEKSLQKDIKEQSIKSTKQSKQSTSDMLNNLIKTGQVTDTYKIFNINWEMKVLNQDELLEAQRETIRKGLSESFTARFANNIVETLSIAIIKVNDDPIHMLFKDIERNKFDTEEGFQYAVRARFRTYLGKLASDILDELFNKYTELNNRKIQDINELKKK